jgi:hypothetical protein
VLAFVADIRSCFRKANTDKYVPVRVISRGPADAMFLLSHTMGSGPVSL